MAENILVVDDEREIADLVEVYLQNEGYTVYKFYNAGDALNCLETTPISLAVLDIMLPDMDGFALCRRIRQKFYFPIIMLTAKVEDLDKIMGLTVGADGPEGGINGGKVIAQGSVLEIMKNKNSFTGQYLKKLYDEQKKFNIAE